MAGEKVIAFSLPNETVEIRYIKKQRGLIVDPKHVAFGGMLEGAYRTYPPKKLRNGNYANVLTDIEKEYLERALALPISGLSVYNKGDNNYWDRVKIKLGKEGTFFDLNDPEQYIYFKVIESYSDEVAPNVSSIDTKQTYRFVIIRKDDEARESLKKFDVTKEAYKLIGKIEDNREQLMDFLRVVGIRVAEDTTLEWMSNEVSKMVVNDPKKFVSLLKDPSYQTKVLLFKALHSGDIIKKGSTYESKDGEKLAEPGKQATLGNVIEYLESNINQEFRLMLMSKLNK